MTGPGVRYRAIYEVVREIPRGSVATYGQIASIVGCGARQVGYAMATLPVGSDVPWQRVVNAQGRVSLRASGPGALLQRTRLEAEGVLFNHDHVIDLDRFGWHGPDWSWLQEQGFDPIAATSNPRRRRTMQ